MKKNLDCCDFGEEELGYEVVVRYYYHCDGLCLCSLLWIRIVSLASPGNVLFRWRNSSIRTVESLVGGWREGVWIFAHVIGGAEKIQCWGLRRRLYNAGLILAKIDQGSRVGRVLKTR